MSCRKLLASCHAALPGSKWLLGPASSSGSVAVAASVVSGLHTTAFSCRTGRFKITRKGDFPLTYEQAQLPYQIGVTKSWNTWNASNLHNPGRHPMNITTEDDFIRQFIIGTWYKIWLSEVVIKRQHNNILVCGIVCPLPSKNTIHFLTGYTEELLSHLLRCNVTVWVQAVNSKANLVHKHV